MPVMRSYGASRLSQGWSCWPPGSEALEGDCRPRGDGRPGGASFTAPSGIIDGFCRVPASGARWGSDHSTLASFNSGSDVSIGLCGHARQCDEVKPGS